MSAESTDRLYDEGCCPIPRREDLPKLGNSYVLDGQRFGYLVVIERSEIRRRFGSFRWVCSCVCGKETVVTADKLMRGLTKSCGCKTGSIISAHRARARSALIEKQLQNYAPEPNTGCWLWLGPFCGREYGTVGTHVGERRAHRFFWSQLRGPIPDGMHVLHRCDTPACVNPGHLFLGTHQDNMTDMARKGRGRYGRKAAA